RFTVCCHQPLGHLCTYTQSSQNRTRREPRKPCRKGSEIPNSLSKLSKTTQPCGSRRRASPFSLPLAFHFWESSQSLRITYFRCNWCCRKVLYWRRPLEALRVSYCNDPVCRITNLVELAKGFEPPTL